MSLVATINTKVSEAVAAQEGGDYATALTKLRSARMLLAGVPDTIGVNGTQLRWDRTSIDAMIKDLERNRSAKAGVRRTRTNYVNVDEDGESCA